MSTAKEALDFLKLITACWPDSAFLHVEAYLPVMAPGAKSPPTLETVALADLDTLVPWIEANQDRDCYYTVGPLAAPQGSGKRGTVTKGDIPFSCFVHLDLDPAEPPSGADLQEHHAAERQRLHKQINDFPLPPSFLIDSGGGFQLLWMLTAPATVAEAEAINKALCQHFDTPDRCHSVQHLLRVAGTTNHPGYKKLAKGRTKVKARLLTATGVAYELSAFAFLPRTAATPGKTLAAVTGDLPPRFVELLHGDEGLRARWEGNPDGMDDTSRNAFDMSITSRAVRHGFNDVEITQILRSLPHGKVYQEGREGTYITDMLAKCRTQRQLSRDTPLLSARRMVAERFTSPDGVSLLRHWNGDFYAWSGGAYCRLAVEDVDARVQAYMEGAQQYNAKKKEIEPFATTPAKVANVRESLGSAFHLDSHRVTPCWLDGADGADPRDLLVLANGVLNLRTRTLQAHDPRLFTTTALPFAYAPDADPPRAWLEFLASVWGGDTESIELLQEYMGYVISGDRSQQKALFIIGPRRSGKGTIEKVLGALVGAANCCSPSLDSLGRNFGLQPMIGKRLALFSDVRLDGRVSQKSVVDKLLSIIGQDDQTIDRKGIPAWTGRLDAAVLATSNELPALIDASGTVASRWKILRMVISFEGREDTRLLDKLLAELPAILNWSLDGLERLQKRGAFVQPQSAMELVEQLADLTSPMGEFIREMCVVDPDAMVLKEDLYAVWCVWNRRRGREHPSEMGVFGRDLIAALPQLTTHQPGPSKADRRRRYVGIGIKNGTCTVEEFRQHPVSDRGFNPVSGQGKGAAAVADLEAARKRRELLL